MSWNTAKKRFQRDIDKLGKQLKEDWLARMTKQYALPTFDGKPLPQINNRKDRKTDIDVGLVSGDLAYITEGEKKGEITTVFQYSPLNDAVLLANVSSKKLIPKSRFVENQTSHYIDYPEYVPRSHVKLVGKDKDENGKVNYLVADEVVFKGRYYDDRYKKWLPKRFVKHHESIEIPWPNPPVDPEDGELSTVEPVAHETTWELQTIAKSPLPEGVINELRNPYSKHKSRTFTELHVSRLARPDMPLTREQKIYLAKKAQQPPKVYKPLSEEIQDFIGSKMADHLNTIEDPNMLKHLDALSKSKIPDFQKTMENIEQNNKSS
jgi:large subunit ribosomal protein L24